MAVMDTIRKTFGIHSEVANKDFTVGIELEIEDVVGWRKNPKYNWQNTEDGSLRNNGREFISPPISRELAVVMFEDLHESLKHSPKYEPFSERTSIHVHVNCLDLSQQQVKSIILWYSLFERMFFAQCAPSRTANIHCVGLDQTIVNESYSRSLPIMVNRWSKYTALNILPLKSQGTIEFRHMEGHADAEKFANWLCCIERLWLYGQENIINKNLLKTDNFISEAFDAIFGWANSPVRAMKQTALEISQDSVLDVKLAFC